MVGNMFKVFLLAALAGMAGHSFAQPYDPLRPPNTYRSPHNPHYWKNRPPFPGYWQQDVYYRIDVTLDDSAETLRGSLHLTYWNNSPDTLTEAFFHLYQNAFQPGSYYDMLHHHNKRRPRYGPYERRKLGTQIHRLTVEGQPVDTLLDNTILKVILPRPLPPDDSITFEIDFTTYFDRGSVRRRMKVFDHHGVKHFDAVHWYPRIAVYDRKFGWTYDQHLGREFYGDFGAYDVHITLPSHYVLEATGFLLNRDEVLPDSLRRKLDIANFKDKPWDSPPSEIIPADGTTKTWRFHAENVHDFAFTADPTYRIGEAEWNGVRAIALVQEPHAARWQEVAKYTADVVRVFSEDFGPYIYHKIVVADARDGMEYPMLTLCGGAWPSNAYLIAHEVGHNWFFGIVGSNETYRALLDEGFTQFLTAWALDKLRGPTRYSLPPQRWLQRFYQPLPNRIPVAYLGYLRDAIRKKDPILATHSDHFNNALRHGGGYRHVYSKTATMLYNLRYVLGGDSLFLDAMQHYYRTWRVAHPYVEDFKTAVIRRTRIDLNWFFDAWIHRTQYIDYRVGRTRRRVRHDSTHFDVRLIRKEDLPMPLEVEVEVRGRTGDSTLRFFIPNAHVYAPRPGARTLRPWIGWNRLNPAYHLRFSVPGKATLRRVEIDPRKEMADIAMYDNRRPLRLKIIPDPGRPVRYSWDRYEVFTRPDLWYNRVDGLQLGWHAHGAYFGYLHRFHLSAWYAAGVLSSDTSGLRQPLSMIFRYDHPILRGEVEASLALRYYRLGRVSLHSSAIQWRFPRRHAAAFGVDFQEVDTPNPYSLIPDGWDGGRHIYAWARHQKRWNHYDGWSRLTTQLRAGISGRFYAVAQAEYQYHRSLGKAGRSRNRWFAYAAAGDVPAQAMLYVAGANPEQMWGNKYYRAPGFFPQQWLGYGAKTQPFYMPGGLNLRGYTGYLMPADTGTRQVWNYRVRHGVAYTTEWEWPRPLRIDNRWFSWQPYAFADVGTFRFRNADSVWQWAVPRADAGVGFEWRWKYGWWPHLLRINVDFPLYLSHVPAAEQNNFQFRYRIRIASSLW